jgi:hypothetical protein
MIRSLVSIYSSEDRFIDAALQMLIGRRGPGDRPSEGGKSAGQ